MTILVHVERLGRQYGGLNALHDVTLDLPVGARHAIIGPNGAGKTTLLNLIAGSLKPSTGRIIFRGRDITRLGPARRARLGIGRTWQHPAVFPNLTIRDHIQLAMAPHRRTSLHSDDLLKRAGLLHEAHTTVAHLSYGQRRLLEFTLALAGSPQLLLLDEPSAGLDSTENGRIAELIADLPTDVTVMIIDHDLDFIWKLATTITVLDQGQSIAVGTPEEIQANQKVQQVYIGTDSPRQEKTTPMKATTGAPVPAAQNKATPARSPILRVQGLRAAYHGAPVIKDIDIDIAPGEILAILGRNGAGKTTLLNSIAGLHSPQTLTLIDLADKALPIGDAYRIAKAGVALVPQGRRLFGPLSVAEHLRIASRPTSTHTGDTTPRVWSQVDVLTLFPPLAKRLNHLASQLSGGEQQMLAIARALLTGPQVLLLDEPGEGLAPVARHHVTEALRGLADSGLAIGVAEPTQDWVTRIADRVIVLHQGQVALRSSVNELTTEHQWSQVRKLLLIH